MSAHIAPVPGAAVVVLLASVLVVTVALRAGRITRQDDELLANMVLVHGVLKRAQDALSE